MDRCALCPGINNCVPPLWGSGYCPGGVMGIAEAPGGQENKKKEVFVGSTGQEVRRHYVPLAGLKIENIIITNAIKCLPPGADGKLDLKNEKDRALLESCTQHHLFREIEQARPRLLVLMGAFACRAIDPDINLELHHGKPLSTRHGVVFPMFHPARGIYEPKKMLHIRTDWYRLRRYLADTLLMPEDPYAGQEDYQLIESERHLDSTLDGYERGPLANDTESTSRKDPYCLTYSTRPGSGYLIRASALGILERYQGHINRWDGPILWHNWLYDGRVVKRMGLKYPRRKIVDTMVRAFHLGNIPQKLKALAYRELGMAMQDFDDVVKPHSTPLALEYFKDALMEEWPRPEPELVRDKDGSWKLYKAQSMRSKFKLFLTAHAKDPENKDPFEIWDSKNWVGSQQLIQEKCGQFPLKCITHVPFEEALYYACRDADALLRLWPILQWMRSQVRHKPQEMWRD